MKKVAGGIALMLLLVLVGLATERPESLEARVEREAAIAANLLAQGEIQGAKSWVASLEEIQAGLRGMATIAMNRKNWTELGFAHRLGRVTAMRIWELRMGIWEMEQS